jgi:hypothetical protein
VFYANVGCEHVAHPRVASRILVIEKEGSVWFFVLQIFFRIEQKNLFFWTPLPSHQRSSMPSACGGYATPRSHLFNKFQQIRHINYYMSVTFFVVVKSVKRC